MFAGKKSAQIREILISESAWEEMTCLFAPSLEDLDKMNINESTVYPYIENSAKYIKRKYEKKINDDQE